MLLAYTPSLQPTLLPLGTSALTAGPYKAALDILLGNRGEEYLAKGIEELELSNIVDIYPY